MKIEKYKLFSNKKTIFRDGHKEYTPLSKRAFKHSYFLNDFRKGIKDIYGLSPILLENISYGYNEICKFPNVIEFIRWLKEYQFEDTNIKINICIIPSSKQLCIELIDINGQHINKYNIRVFSNEINNNPNTLAKFNSLLEEHNSDENTISKDIIYKYTRSVYNIIDKGYGTGKYWRPKF